MLCFVIVAIIDMLQFSGATRWHTTTRLARLLTATRCAGEEGDKMFVDEL